MQVSCSRQWELYLLISTDEIINNCFLGFLANRAWHVTQPLFMKDLISVPRVLSWSNGPIRDVQARRMVVYDTKLRFRCDLYLNLSSFWSHVVDQTSNCIPNHGRPSFVTSFYFRPTYLWTALTHQRRVIAHEVQRQRPSFRMAACFIIPPLGGAPPWRWYPEGPCSCILLHHWFNL